LKTWWWSFNMSTSYNAKIVTDGLVLAVDAANLKSYGPPTVEALVVAGGGGGGRHSGGGGGGGGVLYSSSIVVAAGTAYSVTVGAGGAGLYGVYPTQAGGSGINGGNSVFSTLTAIGGGGGGFYSAAGSAGGSGGGGGRDNGPGAGTAGQGNNGGSGLATGFTAPNYPAHGGGGAGGVGLSGSQSYGGNGGPATLYSITGIPTYYGAGGGGNIQYGVYPGGIGGIGGGGGGAPGDGVTSQYGYDGTANTGGGGGGAHYNAPATGSAGRESRGGTGVVVIRYPGAQKATGGTITLVGGYTVHTFTTSGTFTPGTNWSDLSGNGNTGTLTNGPTYSSANSGGIVFDGVNDYISLSPTTVPLGNAARSVSMWTYLNSAGSGTRQLLYGSGVHGTNFSAFDFEANGYENGVSTKYGIHWWGNGKTFSGSSTTLYNQWVHLTCTHNGGNLGPATVLYINGSLVGDLSAISQTFSTTGATTQVMGFRPQTGGDLPVNGRIANVQVYNRALTASEVAQNFNALRGRYGI
jgi:hypothetical protein